MIKRKIPALWSGGWILLLGVGLVCASMISSFTPASAQTSAALSVEVEAGFENTYKEGEWFPVRMVLENQGPELEAEILTHFVDTGIDVVYYRAPIELPSVSRKGITVYVYPPVGYGTQLKITLSQGRTQLYEKTITLNRLTRQDRLFGVLASNPSSFNVLSALDPINGSATVVELTLQDLPEVVHGYRALDGLVFSGMDTESLTPLQLEALAGWIHQGGSLILTGGADWEATTFGFRATDLLPVEIEGVITVEAEASTAILQQVQAFAGSGEAFLPSENILLANAKASPPGEVILPSPQNADPGLIFRRQYGAGQVLFLAFDPSTPPFRGWGGAQDFYQVLLSNPSPATYWETSILDWNMALQAAQTIPSLKLPSILLICGFLLVYVAILGPVNFILLRIFKRRELGWITIPSMVVFFSILVFLGGSLSRGQKPILNRLTVAQGWAGWEYARVDGIVGIYSPNRTSYEVVAQNPTFLFAVPDLSFGQSKAMTILETANAMTVPDIRVDIGGVFPLAYHSSAKMPAVSSDLVTRIDENGAALEGSLTNQSDLTLENAVLFNANSIIELGDFPPGKTVPVHLLLGQSPMDTAAAGAGGFKPVPGYASPLLPIAPINAIDQILGTYDYYSNRAAYRKYALLVAALSFNPTGLSQNNEAYLIGWSNQSPIEIGLADTSFIAEDLTLYVLGFPSKVEFRGSRWTLTPGFFQWSSLDPLQNGVSPYNQYLYAQTRYSFAFTPRQKLRFSRVESLILHLQNQYETGPVVGARFYLWNYQIQDWEALENLQWGENDLPEPDRFVAMEAGSDSAGSYAPGTIRLQVECTGDYFQIQASDFTLVVER